MSVTRSRSFAVLGQSYGQIGYGASDAYYGVAEKLVDAINTDTAAVQATVPTGVAIAAGQAFQMVNTCVGGSAIWQGHAGAPGYWVSTSGTSNGPLLTSAISRINLCSTDPVIILDSHGEQDATAMDGDGTAATVITCWEYKFQKVREACNAGSPTGVPIFVDILGPRYVADEFDEYALRDAMLGMIDAGTNLYRGAEKYALTLDNTTHPCEDATGYGRMGEWTGRKVAAWLVGDAVPDGPSISGVVRSGNNLTVSIAVGGGDTLVKPTNPMYFGAWNAGGTRLVATGYSWSGNDLTITYAEQPATFRYPAREEAKCDITRVVRYDDVNGLPGFPLESVATVAV